MGSLFSAIRTSRYQAGQVMARHVHDEASLSLVLSGSYEEHIRDRHDSHEAGSLLICPAGEPHAQRFGAKGLFKLVFLPGAEAMARLDDHIRTDDAPALRSQALGEVGQRILAELRSQDDFSALVVEGLAHELIGLTAREYGRRSGALPTPVRIAIDRMHEDDLSPLRLDDLASASGCDTGDLVVAFRRHLGCTPGEYHRRIRIDKAAVLLSSTRDPISDIALACGFSDQPHLTRAFRARMGVTPAAFRRNA